MSPLAKAYFAIGVLVIAGAAFVWWGMRPVSAPPGSAPPASGTPAPADPEAESLLRALEAAAVGDVDEVFGEIDADLNAL